MAETDTFVLDHPVLGSIVSTGRAWDDLTPRVGRPATDAAQIHVTLAEHAIRLDTRMTRIENRLDLVEG